MLDTESFLLGIATGGGGDGGNPNYVETIEGTLANPWGSVDPAALYQSARLGDATVSLQIDGTALGFGHVYIQLSLYSTTYIKFDGISLPGGTVSDWKGLAASYDPDGTLNLVVLLQENTVTDMSAYASATPTTLTIIHHPLP